MQQLSAENYDTIAIQDRFQKLVSPQMWNKLPNIHAKFDFDNHEGFLEWKLVNIYAWSLSVKSQ